MKITVIAAIANNRVIGSHNELPWHLPDDLKHFKTITQGKPVIMGRKTYDSIGKPLPNRHNIVISQNPTLTITGCDVVNSLKDAIKLAEPAKEVMIIGGASIYEQALPLATHMELTLVETAPEGDSFFPPWNQAAWDQTAIHQHPADTHHRFAFRFVSLKRK